MLKRRAKKRFVKSPLESEPQRKLHQEHEEEIELSRDLKRRFRDAHARGENALKDHDYEELGSAIRAEGQIIEAHKRLVTKARKRISARIGKAATLRKLPKS